MRAICTGQGVPKGRKTQGICVPGDDFLWWQNPSWRFQGQAPDCTQDTAAIPGSVNQWDTAIPQPAAHGRVASSGQGADAGSSALLGHHGQRRELSAVYPSASPCAVHMAQPSSPTEVVYLGWVPNVGKLRVRFCEGLRHNWCMAEILWHRRETRRQTENTNIIPGALGGLILLD